MNNTDYNLEKISNILQILSFYILISDFNNNDLMAYLKHQDILLDKIIKQNDELVQLLHELKGGRDGH
jgi:hypothetical protein